MWQTEELLERGINEGEVSIERTGNYIIYFSHSPFNIFLMQRVISVLGIQPNKEINRRLWEESVKFAAIAA